MKKLILPILILLPLIVVLVLGILLIAIFLQPFIIFFIWNKNRNDYYMKKYRNFYFENKNLISK